MPAAIGLVGAMLSCLTVHCHWSTAKLLYIIFHRWSSWECNNLLSLEMSKQRRKRVSFFNLNTKRRMNTRLQRRERAVLLAEITLIKFKGPVKTSSPNKARDDSSKRMKSWEWLCWPSWATNRVTLNFTLPAKPLLSYLTVTCKVTVLWTRKLDLNLSQKLNLDLSLKLDLNLVLSKWKCRRLAMWAWMVSACQLEPLYFALFLPSDYSGCFLATDGHWLCVTKCVQTEQQQQQHLFMPINH